MKVFITMAKVFVSSEDSGLAAEVQKLLPFVNVVTADTEPSGVLRASDKRNIEENAEILLADTPVIIDVVCTAKKLKWAAITSAGVENLIKAIGKEKPPSFTITRMGGAFSRYMAEYVIGYILTKERFIIELANDQERRTWTGQNYNSYRRLTDITIGILGVGEIGKEVARLSSAVGMAVIGVTRSQPSEEKRCPAVSQYSTASELESVLQDCDYVCNILPSTPEVMENRALVPTTIQISDDLTSENFKALQSVKYKMPEFSKKAWIRNGRISFQNNMGRVQSVPYKYYNWWNEKSWPERRPKKK